MAEQVQEIAGQPDAIERWKRIAESNELRARDAEARLRFVEAELEIAELSAKLASMKKQK
jgi:putative heme degradation protein